MGDEFLSAVCLNRFRFQVDVDGLPCFHDSVHQRLKLLEAAHKERVSNLQQRLREAKRKVLYVYLCGTVQCCMQWNLKI